MVIFYNCIYNVKYLTVLIICRLNYLFCVYAPIITWRGREKRRGREKLQLIYLVSSVILVFKQIMGFGSDLHEARFNYKPAHFVSVSQDVSLSLLVKCSHKLEKLCFTCRHNSIIVFYIRASVHNLVHN